MPDRMKTRWLAAAALAVALSALAVAAQADPNTLWNIVHGQCVPDEQQHGDPKPCAEVNLWRGVDGGFVVLKDRSGATQFLLLPTRKITGIEDRRVLAPDATNYFAEAWEARWLVERALGHGMGRDTLSLAVNSLYGRTQNQLHIHIDCVRAEVRAALQREREQIGRRWRPLPVLLMGHRYRAMRVDGWWPDGANPFRLLAAGVAGTRADMGRHTLVVVGADFADGAPGFVILEGSADPAHGNYGSGEELQDHACALGH